MLSATWVLAQQANPCGNTSSGKPAQSGTQLTLYPPEENARDAQATLGATAATGTTNANPAVNQGAQAPGMATSSNQPAGAKTGPQGTAENTTTTASVGQTTPGYQTQAGMEQEAGAKTQYPPTNTQQATPPNAAQAGQTEVEANTNAAAANRAEVGGAIGGGTLGTGNTYPAKLPCSSGSAGKHP